MTYAEAKLIAAALDAEVSRAGAAMDVFPRGPMGLTPDSVKATVEWKIAKHQFDAAFAKLRNFNGAFVKAFAKEMRDERRARRAA